MRVPKCPSDKVMKWMKNLYRNNLAKFVSLYSVIRKITFDGDPNETYDD